MKTCSETYKSLIDSFLMRIDDVIRTYGNKKSSKTFTLDINKDLWNKTTAEIIHRVDGPYATIQNPIPDYLTTEETNGEIHIYATCEEYELSMENAGDIAFIADYCINVLRNKDK